VQQWLHRERYSRCRVEVSYNTAVPLHHCAVGGGSRSAPAGLGIGTAGGGRRHCLVAIGGTICAAVDGASSLIAADDVKPGAIASLSRSATLPDIPRLRIISKKCKVTILAIPIFEVERSGPVRSAVALPQFLPSAGVQ
jgi:hypothetical protein